MGREAFEGGGRGRGQSGLQRGGGRGLVSDWSWGLSQSQSVPDKVAEASGRWDIFTRENFNLEAKE